MICKPVRSGEVGHAGGELVQSARYVINALLGGAKGGSVPFGYLKTNMELDLSCNQDSSIAAATVATAVMHNCTRRGLRRRLWVHDGGGGGVVPNWNVSCAIFLLFPSNEWLGLNGTSIAKLGRFRFKGGVIFLCSCSGWVM